MKEPAIKEVISQIKSADMIIHGIGDAMAMAERRNSPPEMLKKFVRWKCCRRKIRLLLR